MIEARKRLHENQVGKPLMVHLFINHLTMTNHEWERDVHRSGGPLVEYGTYPVDLAEWIIASPIKTVYARAENFKHSQVNGPDNIKILCQHLNGTISSLDIYGSISWTYPMLGLEIVGEEGCLRTDYHNYPVQVHTKDGLQAADPRLSPMNQREIDHFMDCVRGIREPGILPQDFLSAVSILEAVQESIDKDQQIEV